MKNKKLWVSLLALTLLMIGLTACSRDEEIRYVPADQTEAVASSVGWGLGAYNAVDGTFGPMWHSYSLTHVLENTPYDSHFITVDLGAVYRVTRLVYQGRVDVWPNSVITRYVIYTSQNANGPFERAAEGTWSGEHWGVEHADFDAVEARFVRLVALEATTFDDPADASRPDDFHAAASMIRIGVLGQSDYDEEYMPW